MHKSRVWVRQHYADGHVVRGHWRDVADQRRTSTVLSEDLQRHIEHQLSAHAMAVQRVAEIKAQLQQLAAMLAGAG